MLLTELYVIHKSRIWYICMNGPPFFRNYWKYVFLMDLHQRTHQSIYTQCKICQYIVHFLLIVANLIVNKRYKIQFVMRKYLVFVLRLLWWSCIYCAIFLPIIQTLVFACLLFPNNNPYIFLSDNPVACHFHPSLAQSKGPDEDWYVPQWQDSIRITERFDNVISYICYE